MNDELQLRKADMLDTFCQLTIPAGKVKGYIIEGLILSIQDKGLSTPESEANRLIQIYKMHSRSHALILSLQ